MSVAALVGLGSNVNEPAQQLALATKALKALPNTQVTAVSRVYQSPPMGPQDQPDFLNACAALQTALSAETLLECLQGIEAAQGRVKTRHWGERCIDLDLLIMEGVTRNTPNLQLPHPGVFERAFVLQPLRDILGGDFRMPNGAVIDKLLTHCDDGSLVVTQHTLPHA